MGQLEIAFTPPPSEDDLPSSRKTKSTRRKKPVQEDTRIRVAELFAGVGGFRLGLEGHKLSKFGSPEAFRTVWANQWEPTNQSWTEHVIGPNQHAARVYREHFPDVAEFKHFNHDIRTVIDDHLESIEEHDLLCGGFPCQDYSVAKPLKHAAGIVGRKGVLWWAIHDIVQRFGKKAPKYLFLENVDRLLKSPVKRRGRDFAVMLASLANRGYAVEWRVVNAADYGRFQRRRRIFIFAYRKKSPLFQELSKYRDRADEWILDKGLFASALPVHADGQLKELEPLERPKSTSIRAEQIQLNSISSHFPPKNPHVTPFENSGFMIDYRVFTQRTIAQREKEGTLREVVISAQREIIRSSGTLGVRKEIPEEFWVPTKDVEAPKRERKWQYHKFAKSVQRPGKHATYDEGGMSLTDSLDKSARTIITSEGGSTPSRTKHLIDTHELARGEMRLPRGPLGKNRYRRLVPIELELLNDFPPNWTQLDGVSSVRRAFFMGNALVVGIVDRVAKAFALRLRDHKDAKSKSSRGSRRARG